MFAAFQWNTFQNDTVAKLRARYAAAKEKFDQVQEIARVQEESFIGTLNEQMRQLEEQQRRELDGLIEKWRGPNKVMSGWNALYVLFPLSLRIVCGHLNRFTKRIAIYIDRVSNPPVSVSPSESYQ
jgi:hypothetical protein